MKMALRCFPVDVFRPLFFFWYHICAIKNAGVLVGLAKKKSGGQCPAVSHSMPGQAWYTLHACMRACGMPIYDARHVSKGREGKG